MKTVLVPEMNRADYMEFDDNIKEGITVHFVKHFDEVYAHAFSGTEEGTDSEICEARAVS